MPGRKSKSNRRVNNARMDFKRRKLKEISEAVELETKLSYPLTAKSVVEFGDCLVVFVPELERHLIFNKSIKSVISDNEDIREGNIFYNVDKTNKL